MPLIDNPLKVTLQPNPNLKTTINTKVHTGVLEVSEAKSYQARLLGIKGDKGNQGVGGSQGSQGDLGPVGLIYRGQWNNIYTYSYTESVTYDGSLFYYISTTPSIGKLPTDTDYWELIVAQGETGPAGSSDELFSQYTKDPTGFADRTTSTLSFNDGTREFTIEPAVGGGNFIYFVEGSQFIIGSPNTVQIPDTTGSYFIYFNISGALTYSTDYPTFGTIAMVAIIYWDSDIQSVTFFGEERHGISMDWETHYYLHETGGCQWSNGLDISYIRDSDGSTNDELRLSLTNGIIFDEDLQHIIVNGVSPDYFTQTLTPSAELPVWYRSGANGYMKMETANQYPFKMGTSRIEYNNYDDTTPAWELLETPDNSYCAMWIFATNEVDNPVISIMGQHTAVTLDNAILVNSVNTLILGDEFPTPEFKLLYRIIFLCKDSYTNTFNATIKAVTDYRTLIDNFGSGFVGLPPELSGDKYYRHIQSVAAGTWNISHELEKYPAIIITDVNGFEVFTDIQHIDNSNIELTFSEPFSGFAYCN